MSITLACLLLSVSVIVVLATAVAFTAVVINPRTGANTNIAGSPFIDAPPPPLEEPLTLKIVTFNIADGYLFTTNRPERMEAIGALLTKLDPDIVGLQESFIAKDRAILLEALKESRLRYHVNYPAATVGNGLLTLSAWPIVEHYFHRFKASNDWYKLHQGDWWAGKGVGLARIALPSGAHIDFYNTHAQAGRRDNANTQVRHAQMGELAGFMNYSRSATTPAFIVGDFNTKMGRADLQRAMDEADLIPITTVDTGIDFIFAVDHPRYRLDVYDTMVLEGKCAGSGPAIFLSRAPTPRELWHMYFGPPRMTPLSDHRGYMSTVTLTPRANTP